jgi:hypothetical protein
MSSAHRLSIVAGAGTRLQPASAACEIICFSWPPRPLSRRRAPAPPIPGLARPSAERLLQRGHVVLRLQNVSKTAAELGGLARNSAEVDPPLNVSLLRANRRIGVRRRPVSWIASRKFESRTPRHFPPGNSASSWGPFFRLQNVSKSATSFSSSARGNVTELFTSDPVHPRAACFRHRLTPLWPGRVDA